MSGALTVEVSRGAWVESRHTVHLVVCDPDGGIRLAAGDQDRLVMPRSSVKPLQALPLVESGAADRFGVTPTELALACASHSGEAHHVAAVEAWLARLGLSPADLACGLHHPNRGASDWSQAAAGATLSAGHNNCSGKHCGYLTLAIHLGAPVAGYLEPDHPVQLAVTSALAEITGADLSAPPAVDGCGVPVHALPLRSLATAAARWAEAAPERLGPARASAASRLASAVASAPDYIAGSGRLDTLLARHTAGEVVTKTGAEGVYAGYLRNLGLGVAAKTVDGAARAAEAAVGWALAALGALAAHPRAADLVVQRRTLTNHAGRVVGQIAVRPADAFDSP
jgi:L-asparaginase II